MWTRYDSVRNRNGLDQLMEGLTGRIDVDDIDGADERIGHVEIVAGFIRDRPIGPSTFEVDEVIDPRLLRIDIDLL